MSERLHDVVRLTEAEWAEVAARYNLGEVGTAELCADGLVNSNYRLDTSSGSYLLRVYPAERNRAEVEFELSVLAYLTERGFPSPAPVRSADGAQIGEISGRPFSVLTFLPGRTVTRDELTTELGRQVGGAYAEFRRTVQGFRPAGQRENADHDLVARLVEDLLPDLAAADPAAAQLVHQVWTRAAAPFRSPVADRLEVVHGDLYYENILVEDGRLVAFIDFDDAYLGLPVLDLALVVMEFATPADEQLDVALATAVLSAYRVGGGVLPAGEDELHAALLFLCCKFLCYTAPLSHKEGEPLTANSYFRRLADLSGPSGRARVSQIFRGAVDAA